MDVGGGGGGVGNCEVSRLPLQNQKDFAERVWQNPNLSNPNLTHI